MRSNHGNQLAAPLSILMEHRRYKFWVIFVSTILYFLSLRLVAVWGNFFVPTILYFLSSLLVADRMPGLPGLGADPAER